MMAPATRARVEANEIKKGDVLAVARFAGAAAARQAALLLPNASFVNEMVINIDFEVGDDAIDITARVSSPGAENLAPSALAAAGVSALTIYDMCKAVDRSMVVTHLRVR